MRKTEFVVSAGLSPLLTINRHVTQRLEIRLLVSCIFVHTLLVKNIKIIKYFPQFEIYKNKMKIIKTDLSTFEGVFGNYGDYYTWRLLCLPCHHVTVTQQSNHAMRFLGLDWGHCSSSLSSL